MERKKGENATIFLSRETPFLISLLAINRLASIHFSPLLRAWRTNTKYAARGRPVSPRLPKRIRKRGIDPSISPHSPIAIFDSAERSGLEEILPREFITTTNLSTRIQFSRCTRVTRVIPASSRYFSRLPSSSLSLSLFTDRVSAVSACQKRRYTVFASRINFLTSTVYRLVLLLLLLSLQPPEGRERKEE